MLAIESTEFVSATGSTEVAISPLFTKLMCGRRSSPTAERRFLGCEESHQQDQANQGLEAQDE